MAIPVFPFKEKKISSLHKYIKVPASWKLGKKKRGFGFEFSELGICTEDNHSWSLQPQAKQQQWGTEKKKKYIYTHTNDLVSKTRDS